MIESLSGIFTAFGLSSSAGLNAYLPLLIVALTARFTNLITLQAPFDWLTNPWVIALLAVLLLIEIFADKVPVLDHANDVLQTFVRPAAGAIVAVAASGQAGENYPLVMVALGVLLAGGVHVVKAAARPVVNATTGGTGAPAVSTAEDVAAAGTTLIALLVPVLVVVIIVLVLVIAWLVFSRRRARNAT